MVRAGSMAPTIRVLALGAVRREGELLVEEAPSPDTGDPFYRLLGGGVEFGEHSRTAVLREFEEELGVDFVDPSPVGTFEEVFTYAGESSHEIWRVYEGTISEDWPYERDSFTFVDPESETEHRAVWMPIERLRSEETTFYVPEILDALEL